MVKKMIEQRVFAKNKIISTHHLTVLTTTAILLIEHGNNAWSDRRDVP